MSNTIDQREKDIQALCEAVLDMSADFYDNPNGPYETTCPFCHAKDYRGGNERAYAFMSELQHKHDCAYLIAKDLSTGH
jgi:hypothetical protein